MSDFIDELKNEHQSILKRLMNVKRLGQHTMEGRSELNRAKKELLMHLEKEDEQLYPALEERAEGDRELKEMLDPFEDEMKEITAFSIKFFKKYSIGGGGIEFFRDFDRLFNLLRDRIQKEESLLFEKYN